MGSDRVGSSNSGSPVSATPGPTPPNADTNEIDARINSILMFKVKAGEVTGVLERKIASRGIIARLWNFLTKDQDKKELARINKLFNRFEKNQTDLNNINNKATPKRDTTTKSVSAGTLLSEISLPNGVKIQHIDGNILKSDADYIVNPANKDLSWGGGVCGKIHEADQQGKAIVKKNREYLKTARRSKMDVGDVTMTMFHPKNGKAKRILHTAGPDCRIASERKNCKEGLGLCYTNCLKTVCDQKLDSKFGVLSNLSDELKLKKDPKDPNKPIKIAFPVISGGIFQYAPEESIDVTMEALEKFAKDRKPGGPTLIIELITSGENTEIYTEAFNQRYVKA